MTDRIPLDHLTSDQLDALYDQLDELREVAATRKRIARRRREQLDQAEDAITRVRALAERWDNALAPDRAYARALHAALDERAPGPAATQATEEQP